MADGGFGECVGDSVPAIVRLKVYIQYDEDMREWIHSY